MLNDYVLSAAIARIPIQLVITALLLAPATQAPLSAQTSPRPPSPASSKPAGEVPPVGDPQVAFLFLHFHDGLLNDLRSMGNNDNAANSEKAMAASMNVDVADFRAIASVYQQISPLLQAIDTEGVAYRDRVISTGEAANNDTLRQFQVRRKALLQSIKPRLQKALSANGWSALSAYIEGPFRQTVRMTRAR